MKAYIYQAALWCEQCAAELEHKCTLPAGASLDDESSYDSDVYPKGPYADGGGEADTPQHCDGCDSFLCNPLTPDGVAYVESQCRRLFAPPGTRSLTWTEAAELADAEGLPVTAEWLRFYQLDIDGINADGSDLQEVACPICEGDGVGRQGPGACSYCDGSGSIPETDVENALHTFAATGGAANAAI